MSPPIRLLIVDDHEVVRAGLRALFDVVDRVEVVGEAEDTATALAELDRTDPDVVLMDLRLGDESGVDACRAILARRPPTRVLLLSAYADERAAAQALGAGASGFLLKRSSGQAIIRAVKGVRDPDAIVDLEVMRRLAGALHPSVSIEPLTPHERELARLVAEGFTNREIAARLGSPEATVKAQVSRLLARLGLANRGEVGARLAALSEERTPGSTEPA